MNVFSLCRLLELCRTMLESISNHNFNQRLRGDVLLNYTCLRNFWSSKLSSSEMSDASLLSEMLLVRDGGLFLDNFNRDEVDSIIAAMITCLLFTIFSLLCTVFHARACVLCFVHDFL